MKNKTQLTDEAANRIKPVVIKSVLPTVKEVREEGIKYSWDCWQDEDYNKDERKYSKKDFIEGAEWMRKQLVGKTVL